MTTFIGEYHLSDTSICDAMIKMFHRGEQLGVTRPGLVGHDGVIDDNIKKSVDLPLSLANRVGSVAEFKWLEYHEELMIFTTDYLKQLLLDEYGGTFVMKYLPQIQHYKPGDGYYKWHVDGAQRVNCDKAIVYITYLNDLTDGGGTMFYHQNYTVNAVKGKTILFPASFTHLHRGEVSQSQHKYILTGWLWWE